MHQTTHTIVRRPDPSPSTAEILLSQVVERAEQVAQERARRVRAARRADRADLLAFIAERDSLLAWVESCDDLGCPTLSADAPDLCENPW